MHRILKIAAAALTLAVAGEAGAVPAQCFWQGQPYGPIYRTEAQGSDQWVYWVQRRGGSCRPINQFETQIYQRRPQVYPPEYTAGRDYGPRYPQQPPPGGDEDENWRGDPNRAAYLVSQWLSQQGRAFAQVRDTGRIDHIYDRRWRIFFARWQDGNRARIAVRYSRRRGGTYLAMMSYGGGQWGEPQPIGQ
jgi:hypothetical protein